MIQMKTSNIKYKWQCAQKEFHSSMSLKLHDLFIMLDSLIIL